MNPVKKSIANELLPSTIMTHFMTKTIRLMAAADVPLYKTALRG